MRWASARCKSQCGEAMPNSVRHGMAGRDETRQGKACLDKGCRRQHGGVTLPAALYGSSAVGPALVRRGEFRLGEVARGLARATDGGTEGFGSPCHPHGWLRPGKTWQGKVHYGMAGRGQARHGPTPWVDLIAE